MDSEPKTYSGHHASAGPLSQDLVDQVVVQNGRRLIGDHVCAGLLLSVRPGRKTWIYRPAHSNRTSSITLGDAGEMTLEEARQRVSRFSGMPATHAHAVADGEMPTFAEFLLDRYMPYALATKRSACWEQIIFKNHLLPAFGQLKLNEITKSSVSYLIQEKVAAGYKPGTVNRILANLKTVLSKAVEWDIGGLDKNVAKQVKALRDPPHLDRFLSRDEADRLIEAVRQSNSPMLPHIVPFLLFTGARKREALDARWSYIDLEQKLWTIPITKSGKPRYVPLSNQAVLVLSRAKATAKRLMGEECDWVFPNPATGKPYTSIFEPWDNCRKSVGLADVRIHDLRHSFASALVNRGMTLYDVKEVLGHSNISTTQRYAHLSPERLREAVRQAGDHYAPEKSRARSGKTAPVENLVVAK